MINAITGNRNIKICNILVQLQVTFQIKQMCRTVIEQYIIFRYFLSIIEFDFEFII